MTLEEIEVVRDGFIAGAVRAKQAGYDGITLAGQGTYLLMQFHSPRMNVRTDRYGGSPEKRMTLALEIVRGIRRECGPGFILGYGMVADELMPGGIEIEHSVPFAVALEQEGVDYIDVRVGHQESYTTTERATGHSRHHKRTGIWGDYAEHFKKALKVPVFCSTQGCYDPAQWEQALQKGQVDVIQIAKPLLADHDLPNKVLEGRAKDVRPCVLCLFCVDVTTNDMYCTVNPELGHETKMAIRPALDSKKVMVVGGGPAGLEAARVAALRGHQVTVIEKQADLGGNLLTLSICPGGDIYLGLRDWLVRQCAGAGVKFEVGKTANVQVVRKERPDVVIAAVGAPAILLPPVPGIDKPHVVTAIDVLHGKAALGKDIVVLGGGMIGVDTALAFAIRGGIHNITIIETLRVPTLAYDESFLERTYTTMTLLPKYSIRGISGICVDEITNNQVVISDQDGKRQKIKADTVVIAMGFKPNPSLYEALRAENVELYTIGDCVRPQSVGEAMHDAAGVARQI
jgi:NADPH-dependent 2,4-dienoyl-CoA reductase/sulfur reductase-like enzyme